MKKYSILVTGGTGSFGKQFVGTILEKHPEFNRVVVFSRDELKQFEMSQKYPIEKYPQIRYFLGDVRDRDRVRRALEDIDIVIHAAALKQVPAAEYNPFECIKTNVMGAQNIIEACLDSEVKKVIALSTDKASGPTNLYGATKLCSDKLFVAANNMKGAKEIKFSVVRYGNVMGSRGSVIPLFLDKRKEGVIPITDERMTRFNITLDETVKVVLKSLEIMWGGEIFVPKIPSYRIVDLAEAIAPDCHREIIGIRPGEKIHEEMISATDALHAAEFEDYYVILPSLNIWPLNLWNADEFIRTLNGRPCQDGFSYSSATNTDWLSVEQIRDLIHEHIDPAYSV